MRWEGPRDLALAVILFLGCAASSHAGPKGVATGKPTPPRAPVQAVHVARTPPSEPVEVLLQRLSGTDPALRAAAAWDLARISAPGEDVAAQLRTLEKDPDRKVRYAATWALGPLETPSTCEPPKLLKRTMPNYPQAAFDKWIQGTVATQVLIGEEGEVVHVEVIESIPALDLAAMDCVRSWRFAPATCDGQPVAVVALAPVTFMRY